MSEMISATSGTHIIASYNISFASGLGLDPRRADVFESEGNFLMKNVEDQKEQEEINFKQYWLNALANVKSLWTEKRPCFMGFQEMNKNDEFGGTKTLIDEIQIINPNTVCEICEIDAPNNGKTSVMSVWDTTILGAKTQSASYDLGEGDGPYGIGRPICIVLHRPKRKMRQTFYKKIKNYQFLFFGDVKAPLKGVILFDDYNLL